MGGGNMGNTPLSQRCCSFYSWGRNHRAGFGIHVRWNLNLLAGVLPEPELEYDNTTEPRTRAAQDV